MSSFWYKEGTCSASGTTVRGTNTRFLSNVIEGDLIYLSDSKIYCVVNVISDSQLTIDRSSGAGNGSYFVVPTQGHDFELARALDEMTSAYRQRPQTLEIVDTTPANKTSDVIYVLDHQLIKKWQAIGGFTTYASANLGEVSFTADRNAKSYQLKADGSIVSKTTYRALWEWAVSQGLRISNNDWAAGTYYFGDVDGSSFKLPDLKDQFLRVAGSGRKVGSNQGDAIRNITGQLGNGGGDPYGIYYADSQKGAFVNEGQSNKTALSSPAALTKDRAFMAKFDASRVVPTADENRPKNTALNAVITAF